MSEDKRKLRCANCGKEMGDGAYSARDNWLQWEHYTRIGPPAEANCYCSKECFADDWMVEWTGVDEMNWWGDDDDQG